MKLEKGKSRNGVSIMVIFIDSHETIYGYVNKVELYVMTIYIYIYIYIW